MPQEGLASPHIHRTSSSLTSARETSHDHFRGWCIISDLLGDQLDMRVATSAVVKRYTLSSGRADGDAHRPQPPVIADKTISPGHYGFAWKTWGWFRVARFGLREVRSVSEAHWDYNDARGYMTAPCVYSWNSIARFGFADLRRLMILIGYI